MARGNGRATNSAASDRRSGAGAAASGAARGGRRARWEDFAHSGPGTLAGRYLRQFWQPVYAAADLPAGRAKPIKLLCEEFTLYRGAGGAAHVVDFRCPHRGTQLSTGWVRGDHLRCLYHGWTFDGSGQCVEQPAEPEPFCQKIRLRSYPTAEYLGLIFAYFGDGPAPPLPRYPEFEEEGILQSGGYVVPADAGILFYISAAVPKHAAHPAAAKLWINYLLSREAQDLIYASDFTDLHLLPGSKTAADVERAQASGVKLVLFDASREERRPPGLSQELGRILARQQ